MGKKQALWENRMIRFDKLWIVMEKKGISTYRLREDAAIENKTIQRLRQNLSTETKTLNRICKALDCKLEDIAEYVPD